MKRSLFALTLAVGIATSAGAGPAINWASDFAFNGGAPECVDKDGNLIPKTSTWAVQILEANSKTNLYTAPYSPGVGFWEILATDGAGYTGIDGTTPGLDAWNGLSVITRVWASSTVGNPATDWHADTTSQVLSWSVAPPATTADYNFGEITQPMWVPEPGTGILVLAGAALMIFRRRRTEA